VYARNEVVAARIVVAGYNRVHAHGLQIRAPAFNVDIVSSRMDVTWMRRMEETADTFFR
jgi:hypothetical protein